MHKGGNGMEIKSTAFENDGMIPGLYTCDGEDISPPLEWHDAPDGTQSFSLICDDPDAPMGIWVHWVVYDIPSNVNTLPEHAPSEKELTNGGKQGRSDFGTIGYGGPCPPSGTHRYFFKLYALDSYVDLQPGATKEQLLKAMKGHILGESTLIGNYRR
ncbi:MAG: YbhB/YbcL family Raf kinase inhibitor-like protein [Deltaproteobacteria bacterium]|nr:YbhB/YbcL family Raf kinase inhibitor-like protein [Deltaproteobacteria bacterium]